MVPRLRLPCAPNWWSAVVTICVAMMHVTSAITGTARPTHSVALTMGNAKMMERYNTAHSRAALVQNPRCPPQLLRHPVPLDLRPLRVRTTGLLHHAKMTPPSTLASVIASVTVRRSAKAKSCATSTSVHATMQTTFAHRHAGPAMSTTLRGSPNSGTVQVTPKTCVKERMATATIPTAKGTQVSSTVKLLLKPAGFLAALGPLPLEISLVLPRIMRIGKANSANATPTKRPSALLKTRSATSDFASSTEPVI